MESINYVPQYLFKKESLQYNIFAMSNPRTVRSPLFSAVKVEVYRICFIQIFHSKICIFILLTIFNSANQNVVHFYVTDWTAVKMSKASFDKF